jgi:hypothetical protein
MTVETWEDGALEALCEIANRTNYYSNYAPAIMASSASKDLIAGRWDADHYLNFGRYFLDELDMGYDEIITILADKQRKYGAQNILGFGHTGIQVRLNDKCARIINCANLDIADAENPMFDFLGYCVVGIMLERGWFELPLAADAPPPASQNIALTNAEWMARGEFDWPDEQWTFTEASPNHPDYPLAATKDDRWVTPLIPYVEPTVTEPTATYIPTFVAYWDGNYQMTTMVWEGDKLSVEYRRLP